MIGATPLLGTGFDRDKIPASIAVYDRQDLHSIGLAPMLNLLEERTPSVAIGDAQGNEFQPNLVYRGFVASPLDGNPQGIAVYANGIRLNQPFADTVNWDLLPDIAIDKLNLQSSNPAFGLNALGGALSIRLKNGFTYQGSSSIVRGGSFGTLGGSFEYGRKSGDTAAYFATNAVHSDGWRQSNQSDVRQFFGDLGWRGKSAEVHATVLLADNMLNGPGTTPVELLNAQRNAAFTLPNATANKYALVGLNGTWDASDTTSIQGAMYYSNLSQRIVNGNTTSATPCGGNLCDDNGKPLIGRNGAPIPDFLNGGPYAQLNSLGLDTNGYGVAAQLTHEGAIFGLHNKIVSGASFDGGLSSFGANTAIGGVSADRRFIGPGSVVVQPDGSIAPVKLGTSTRYYGMYLSDIFDATPSLSVSFSARLNIADIDLHDRNGSALNGSHRFVRLNPGIGATYKISPTMSVYASYTEANRAPTPSELSCASSAMPCTLANFFVGDPSLKQVVGRTVEVGLRGQFAIDPETTMEWNLAAYRTDTSDEILFVASDTPGLAYFQNVPLVRRQGIEIGTTLRSPRLRAWLNYTYTDATFQTALTLASPLNPMADANGQIHLSAGNRLPGIPRHRVKAGLSYAANDAWTVGVSAVFSSGQTLFGDEANLTPETGVYLVVSANTSYRLTESVELFALVRNVLNAKYETFGTFSSTSAIPIAQVPGAANTRSLSPAPPVAGFAGMRVTF